MKSSIFCWFLYTFKVEVSPFVNIVLNYSADQISIFPDENWESIRLSQMDLYFSDVNQSQRKAMPKNAQSTVQLHSSHTLVK